MNGPQRQTGTRRADGLSGLQLLGCVAAILVLAIPAPVAFAVAVNRSRVARANADVRAIAAAIAAVSKDGGSQRTPAVNATVDLLIGPGNVPRQKDGRQWIGGKTASLAELLAASHAGAVAGNDPWGNRYTVNIGAAENGNAIWVLSAGPNGIVETPFAQEGNRATLGGDDVGARVR